MTLYKYLLLIITAKKIIVIIAIIKTTMIEIIRAAMEEPIKTQQ